MNMTGEDLKYKLIFCPKLQKQTFQRLFYFDISDNIHAMGYNELISEEMKLRKLNSMQVLFQHQQNSSCVLYLGIPRNPCLSLTLIVNKMIGF